MIFVRRGLPGFVILLDQQYAGEFSMGAGGRLKGHVRHAGDFAQILLGGIQNLPAALRRMLRRQRMDSGKAGQRSHFLIDAGIVFHGTGAQRIKAAVHAVNLPAQLAVMAGNLAFAHFRQPGSVGPLQAFRQRHLLHITGGQYGTAPAGHAFSKINFMEPAPPSQWQWSGPCSGHRNGED